MKRAFKYILFYFLLLLATIAAIGIVFLILDTILSLLFKVKPEDFKQIMTENFILPDLREFWILVKPCLLPGIIFLLLGVAVAFYLKRKEKLADSKSLGKFLWYWTEGVLAGLVTFVLIYYNFTVPSAILTNYLFIQIIALGLFVLFFYIHQAEQEMEDKRSALFYKNFFLLFLVLGIILRNSGNILEQTGLINNLTSSVFEAVMEYFFMMLLLLIIGLSILPNEKGKSGGANIMFVLVFLPLLLGLLFEFLELGIAGIKLILHEEGPTWGSIIFLHVVMKLVGENFRVNSLKTLTAVLFTIIGYLPLVKFTIEVNSGKSWEQLLKDKNFYFLALLGIFVIWYYIMLGKVRGWL